MNKFNWLITLLLTTMLFTLTSCGGNDGNGIPMPTPTPTPPPTYPANFTPVATAGELLAVVERLNNGEALDVIVVADIALTAPATQSLTRSATSNWTPIKNFGGTFDGDNHTISGIVIDEQNSDDIGFFSRINSEGTVKNLKLKDITVKGKDYVGGVAGLNYGTVSNVAIIGTSEITGNFTVGGVVGNNRGTIVASYSEGDISGRDSVGGIVGENYNSIVASYNKGDIEGNEYVGGIAGYNGGDIYSIYNTGNVTTTSGSTNIGGIVGFNDLFSAPINAAYYLSNETINTGLTDQSATSVATIAELNNFITELNNGIDDFDSGSTYVVGFEFVSGGTDAPTLKQVTIAVAGVTVSSDSTYITPNGGTTQINVAITPVNAVANITYQSDNESVATVSTSGLVTGHAEGTANIKVFVDNVEYGPVKIIVEPIGYTVIDENNWEISRAGGLIAFKNEVKNNSDLNATLTDNIILVGDWTPITEYLGTFDGGNYIITGVNIETQNASNTGFISKNYGTVKNLKLKDITVKGDEYVGGVAGRNYGTISNVAVIGSSIIEVSRIAGGIVGYNEDNGIIVASYNEATVIGFNSNIGGIVGLNDGSVVASYNKGDIEGNEHVGGIVGYNKSNANIYSVYNTGNITTTTGSSNIGGIIGNNSGTLHTAYYLSDATVNDGLFAIGRSGSDDSSKNIASVAAIADINGKITELNDGIGEFERAEDYGTGYRFENSGAETPTLRVEEIAIKNITLIESIYLSPNGSTLQLTMVTSPTNAPTTGITYESDNLGVATVTNSGLVTSGSEGTATITATFGSLTTSIIISVEEAGHRVIDGNNWEIFAENGLEAFRITVNSGNSQLDAKLTADITLTEPWTPITEYRGIFDGDNKTITGVNIDMQDSNNVGFIGKNYGTVKNLKLKDITVIGDEYVGGVVGYNYKIIENVAVIGNSTINGYSYVGGITGYIDSFETIREGYNEATVTGAGNYVGGIAGYNSSSSEIIASYNKGNITSTTGYDVGGIAGRSHGTIVASYNKGDISGNSNVGGVVGWNNTGASKTYAVYNTGNVTSTTGGSNIGGIIGYLHSDSIFTTGYYLKISGGANDGRNAVGNSSSDDTTKNIEHVSAISGLDNEKIITLNNALTGTVGAGYKFVDADNNAETSPTVVKK